MWCCMTGWMVPCIIRECIAFIFRVSKVQSFLNLMTAENESIRSFETWRTTHPTVQRHIPEDPSPQFTLQWKPRNNMWKIYFISRSQWPCGLRHRSTAAWLLRSWVRIPLEAWMFVCCDCCVLSGRGLCDRLITHPGGSYRLWRVVVCDQETSYARRL